MRLCDRPMHVGAGNFSASASTGTKMPPPPMPPVAASAATAKKTAATTPSTQSGMWREYVARGPKIGAGACVGTSFSGLLHLPLPRRAPYPTPCQDMSVIWS
eukprot:scaffold1438_cov126-Isochrysis_galbana.AAC.7